MSREHSQPLNRSRLVVWIGVTCVAVMGAAVYARWDALVERWHRLELRHGSEASAFRAAAALTAGNEESLELVREWAFKEALAAALAREPADPTRFPFQREATLRAVARELARAGDMHRAEAAVRAMDPARQEVELSALRQLVASRGTRRASPGLQ
jgi:hypothetical protein